MSTGTDTGTAAPTDATDGMDWVAAVRRRLAELAEQVVEVAGAVAGTRVESLERLREKVGNDDFVVLVAGEFSTGKSTTINAMLGDRVLPAYAVPTTAVLSVVGWGEQPRVELFEFDPHSEGGVRPEGRVIDVSELERHVTVDDDDPERENPWGKAEISWPLKLCRSGVRVVDSPGLNDDPKRSAITEAYLGRADAVVFVLDATRALALSEREFLDLQVKALGHEDMFFLCNKINMIDPAERDRVRQRVRKLLGAGWGAGDDRVFFVDARAALTGRRDGDPTLVDTSGMPQFERHLERFLTSQRARMKILPPARHLQHTASELRELIHQRMYLLDQDVDELRERYDRAQVPLRQLERERQLIVRMVEQHLAETCNQVEVAARRELMAAADSCPRWVKEIVREHHVGANPFKVQEQVDAAAREVADRLSAKLTETFTHWQHTELTALLENRATALEREIDDSLRSFADRIQQVQLSFVPHAKVDAEGGKSPGGVERVLSAAVGWFIDPGSALLGARFGFRHMMRAALPQLAIAFAAGVLGFGPLVIVALLTSSGVLRGLVNLRKADQQLAEKIAQQVADEIRRTAADQAAQLAKEVRGKLDAVRDAVDDALGLRISEVRQTVEDAVDQLTQGQEAAAAAKQRLAAQLTVLNAVEREAVAVIADFATRG